MFDSLRKQFLFLILLPMAAAFSIFAVLNYQTAHQLLAAQLTNTGRYYLRAAAEKMSGGIRLDVDAGPGAEPVVVYARLVHGDRSGKEVQGNEARVSFLTPGARKLLSKLTGDRRTFDA